MTDYQAGFGASFASEALPGALPVGRNSPQRCPYGLYAEQVSGTPFTAPRAVNRRSWLYRIRPSVCHWGDFARIDPGHWHSPPGTAGTIAIGPLRWDPLPLPDRPVDFVAGIHIFTLAGDVATRSGMAAGSYLATCSMTDRYFYNADAEMLLVPQQGGLRLVTELGVIEVAPGEIAVLPRGIKLRAELVSGPARGYLCENYGSAFTLPERGLIGANSLAETRDFLSPVAAFEERDGPALLTVKWGGILWQAAIAASPLDVVAWHGSYVPYKYDLRRFCPVGSVAFDHPDPSISTVLTAPSALPGTANVDFVIFPERWNVAEDTFRPPWYHMNVMSEFMGLIDGVYDAKPEGFRPGGISLHNSFQPHGPDARAYAAASTAALRPAKLSGTLAVMFETALPQFVTPFAAGLPQRQPDYAACWDGLARTFDRERP